MSRRRRVRVLVGSSLALAGVMAVVVPATWPSTSFRRPAAQLREPAVALRAIDESTAPPSRGRERGSERWRLQKAADEGQIEGYTTAAGAPPGRSVRLRVSTDARAYVVRAFRIGSYRGGTGRQVWASPVLDGERQPAGWFRPGGSHMVTAAWQDSVVVSTAGWPEGFYVFKLIASSGWQAHVPYVVTSRSVRDKVVLVAPVTTWQAYNDWGGYSLYDAPRWQRRSWAVSFDRPYPAPGSKQMMYGVVPVVIAAERLGVPLGYLTSVDLDASRRSLRGAAAYVSMGHDEYWTLGMRRTVLRARNRGTNLVFLGANTMYWRVRMAATSTGARRQVIGYRHDAAMDPATVRGDPDSTARFRDQPHPRPENEVTGMLYECFPVDEPFRVVSPKWWGFADTGVRRNDSFDNLVGVEADRVYPWRSTPRPLQIVAHVDYSCRGVPTSAQSTYYTTPSGAGVFNAGTLRWTCALAARCSTGLGLSVRTQRFVRQVTDNVLRVFATGPAGRGFPARDNVASFHLPTDNRVPAS